MMSQLPWKLKLKPHPPNYTPLYLLAHGLSSNAAVFLIEIPIQYAARFGVCVSSGRSRAHAYGKSPLKCACVLISGRGLPTCARYYVGERKSEERGRKGGQADSSQEEAS